jgi:hypothetical protein
LLGCKFHVQHGVPKSGSWCAGRAIDPKTGQWVNETASASQNRVKIDLRNPAKLEAFVQAFIRHTPESDALNATTPSAFELLLAALKGVAGDEIAMKGFHEQFRAQIRNAIAAATKGSAQWSETKRLENEVLRQWKRAETAETNSKATLDALRNLMTAAYRMVDYLGTQRQMDRVNEDANAALAESEALIRRIG